MSYAHPILASNLPPARAYVQILDAMNERHFSATNGRPASFDEGLSVLSPGERALILATHFRNQVYADGFHDYFGNTNCKHAHETARGFERIGLSEAAEFLRRALS